MKLNTKILKGFSQAQVSIDPIDSTVIDRPDELLNKFRKLKVDGKDKGFVWNGTSTYLNGGLDTKITGYWGITITKTDKTTSYISGNEVSAWNFVLDINGEPIIEFKKVITSVVIQIMRQVLKWVDEAIKNHEKIIEKLKMDFRTFEFKK